MKRRETYEDVSFLLLFVPFIASGLYALSAHVVVHDDAMGQNDAILQDVKSRLRRGFGIDHTTIQIESAAYAHVDDIHEH